CQASLMRPVFFAVILSVAVLLSFAPATTSLTAHRAASSLDRRPDLQEPQVAAEAPPLLWPAWLVHIQGTQMKIQQGADGKIAYLQGSYYTRVPMTRIRSFYQELLKANAYQMVTGGLETGHTMSGVQQNAFGQVEGDNYPDGQPGPWTNIRIDFSRAV